MDPLQTFGEYAAEFEKTFEDDDWTRLERFFAPEARYVVAGSPYDCDLRGRDAVLVGIKKALDGFDRRFDQREILPEGPPTADGNRVTIRAAVRYQREGVEPLTIQLAETAELDDAGRIVLLRDDYDAGQEDAARWLEAHASEFDPRYE